MDDTSQNVTIPLLKDNNYHEWLIDIKVILRGKKLWDPIQAPAKGDKSKHIEAADIMTPKISPTVKRKLKTEDFDDGYLMLHHLKEIYAPATETVFLRSIQELLTLRIEATHRGTQKDVEAYLSKVKTLSEQIDATNITLTPNRRTLLVLQLGLRGDSKFNTLVQVWGIANNILLDNRL
jgi:hypothetical protein